ncbi:MAG: (2Fe-2S) ferredoxin domain-containing protein [Acidobacteriota bacterium]
MSKPKFIEDSKKLEKLAPVVAVPIKRQVFVCNGKSCLAVGSAEVKTAFEEELQKRNLRYGKESKGRNPRGEIMLTDCSSVGLCSVGAAVLVYPEGVWYAQVCASDVPEIIEKHLIGGKKVERLALKEIRSADGSSANERSGVENLRIKE